MTADLYLHCPTCARIRPAETPDCAEGHGADCPDRVCLSCGTALFTDPLISAAALRAGVPAPRAA